MPLQTSARQAEKKPQGNKAKPIENELEIRQADFEEQHTQLKTVLGSSVQEQASNIHDPRFMAAQRQDLAGQIGRVAGNRQLQRVIDRGREASSRREIRPTSSRLVQRGIWDAIRDWWSGLWSADPEDVVRNLDTGLGHANTALEAITSTTVDPQRRAQLERLGERVEGLSEVTSGIVRVLDTAEKIEKVEEFVEALNDIPNDIASDPEGAADAFGRLFASAGELGQMLPEGPWTGYFEFLAGSRNFFTDMLQALDPGRRWRRQFEEAEREAGNPTSRGVQ